MSDNIDREALAALHKAFIDSFLAKAAELGFTIDVADYETGAINLPRHKAPDRVYAQLKIMCHKEANGKELEDRKAQLAPLDEVFDKLRRSDSRFYTQVGGKDNE